MLALITLTVPVPDSPIFWAGVGVISVLAGVRLILGLWEKVKP